MTEPDLKIGDIVWLRPTHHGTVLEIPLCSDCADERPAIARFCDEDDQDVCLEHLVARVRKFAAFFVGDPR